MAALLELVGSGRFLQLLRGLDFDLHADLGAGSVAVPLGAEAALLATVEGLLDGRPHLLQPLFLLRLLLRLLSLKLAGAGLVFIGDLYVFLGNGFELLPAGSAILGLGGIDLQPAVVALLQLGRRLLVQFIDDAILQLPHGLLVLQLLSAAVLVRQLRTGP